MDDEGGCCRSSDGAVLAMAAAFSRGACYILPAVLSLSLAGTVGVGVELGGLHAGFKVPAVTFLAVTLALAVAAAGSSPPPAKGVHSEIRRHLLADDSANKVKGFERAVMKDMALDREEELAFKMVNAAGHRSFASVCSKLTARLRPCLDPYDECKRRAIVLSAPILARLFTARTAQVMLLGSAMAQLAEVFFSDLSLSVTQGVVVIFCSTVQVLDVLSSLPPSCVQRLPPRIIHSMRWLAAKADGAGEAVERLIDGCNQAFVDSAMRYTAWCLPVPKKPKQYLPLLGGRAFSFSSTGGSERRSACSCLCSCLPLPAWLTASAKYCASVFRVFGGTVRHSPFKVIVTLLSLALAIDELETIASVRTPR